MQPLILISLLLCFVITCVTCIPHTVDEVERYLKNEYESEASAMCTASVLASWNYETDITPEHEKKVTEATLRSAEFDKKKYEEWFKNVNVTNVRDEETRRLLKDLQIQGTAALDQRQLTELTQAITAMMSIYSSAQICPLNQQTDCAKEDMLDLEPGIEKILAESTNYTELQYVWKAWHDASGKKMRGEFEKYVRLSNEVGRLNGFEDYGAYWRESFDTENFEQKLDAIWDKLKPFYQTLFNYAAKKLQQRYGKQVDFSDGLLPAHIFGNMWAQSWINLEKLLKPYPNESVVDITAQLRANGFTVRKIFETADDFYTSLGLPSNAVSYGPLSMIERPDGKQVTCHASAWDFCNKADFLIKMCTEVNHEDFITVHHEMGHIQYYLQYKEQLIGFREGANPGFHEAVGDTMALSVQSTTHLKKVNLLPATYKESDEASLNSLMSMALEKIAFLPFGLLIDKWRWAVFSGKVGKDQWNAHWWKLRKEYQLIKPPMERTEEDFDPGAKFHVAADSQYISYFVSHVLQFQFFRALCIEAGQYDPVKKSPPLHMCDFYQNKAAGDLLKKGLSLGKSKPWPEVLKIMTGSTDLDVEPLLEYFEPLSKYFAKKTDSNNPASRNAPFLLLMVGTLFVLKVLHVM